MPQSPRPTGTPTGFPSKELSLLATGLGPHELVDSGCLESVHRRKVPAPGGGQGSGPTVLLLCTSSWYLFSICFLLLVSTTLFPLPNCKGRSMTGWIPDQEKPLTSWARLCATNSQGAIPCNMEHPFALDPRPLGTSLVQEPMPAALVGEAPVVAPGATTCEGS